MNLKRSIVFKEKGNHQVFCVAESEIAVLIRESLDKNIRRKIIRKHLLDTITGKEFCKSLSNGHLIIRNTKRDSSHLTHNEHLDTSLALTSVKELIEFSEYIGEQALDASKKPNSPNDYYWYFKVTVEIDGVEYIYTLNIGRNKTDKHACLYAITNYNKKER